MSREDANTKAIAMARRGGMNVDGAVAAGRSTDSSADYFLVVFADRVELARAGKRGPAKSPRLRPVTIPIAQISLAECHHKGSYSMVRLHAADAVIRFRADRAGATRLHEAVLGLMNADPAPDTEKPAESPDQD